MEEDVEYNDDGSEKFGVAHASGATMHGFFAFHQCLKKCVFLFDLDAHSLEEIAEAIVKLLVEGNRLNEEHADKVSLAEVLTASLGGATVAELSVRLFVRKVVSVFRFSNPAIPIQMPQLQAAITAHHHHAMGKERHDELMVREDRRREKREKKMGRVAKRRSSWVEVSRDFGLTSPRQWQYAPIAKPNFSSPLQRARSLFCSFSRPSV